MVTLLGFFFILGNIGLLVIYMPDLVGPVRPCTRLGAISEHISNVDRFHVGPVMVVFQFRVWSLYVPDHG
jgi:hypothetical protein